MPVLMGGGVYYLVVDLPQDLTINVGRLGPSTFYEGIYVYVGSGKGSGGVYRRISRHIVKNKKVFWHIDYLTTNSQVRVLAAIAIVDKKLDEPVLVRLLRGDRCFKPAVRGFGCSDVKDDFTHLFLFTCEQDVFNYLINKLIRVGVPQSAITQYRFT